MKKIEENEKYQIFEHPVLGKVRRDRETEYWWMWEEGPVNIRGREHDGTWFCPEREVIDKLEGEYDRISEDGI